MPIRKTPLITDQIYHVFNRSVAGQIIFRNSREYKLFIELVEYYSFSDVRLRFSHYTRLEKNVRIQTLDELYKSSKRLVNVYAFCVMPNHYHILVKQNVDNGISDFIRKLQGSYAHYLNIKTKRAGSVYQSPFKGSLIEYDEQFIHVARYIHINPLTSYLLDKKDKLKSYTWNSYRDYIGVDSRKFIKKNKLLNYFNSTQEFIDFTLNQVDYQRELHKIKHLIQDKK